MSQSNDEPEITNEIVSNVTKKKGEGVITMELLRNNQVLYDFHDMMKTFEQFKMELKPLTNLNKGDKIGIDKDDNMYIDENDRFQYFRRWYNNQDRDTSMLKLTTKLKEYFILIEMVITSLHSSNKLFLRVNNSIFMKFCIEIMEMNIKYIAGLNSLCKTYKKDKEYVSGLNKLIDSLCKKNKQLRIEFLT